MTVGGNNWGTGNGNNTTNALATGSVVAGTRIPTVYPSASNNNGPSVNRHRQ